MTKTNGQAGPVQVNSIPDGLPAARETLHDTEVNERLHQWAQVEYLKGTPPAIIITALLEFFMLRFTYIGAIFGAKGAGAELASAVIAAAQEIPGVYDQMWEQQEEFIHAHNEQTEAPDGERSKSDS
jgi:hypothetical protein